MKELIIEAGDIAWLMYEFRVGNLYSNTFKDAFELGAEWMKNKIVMDLSSALEDEDPAVTLFYLYKEYKQEIEKL